MIPPGGRKRRRHRAAQRSEEEGHQSSLWALRPRRGGALGRLSPVGGLWSSGYGPVT